MRALIFRFSTELQSNWFPYKFTVYTELNCCSRCFDLIKFPFHWANKWFHRSHQLCDCCSIDWAALPFPQWSPTWYMCNDAFDCYWTIFPFPSWKLFNNNLVWVLNEIVLTAVQAIVTYVWNPRYVDVNNRLLNAICVGSTARWCNQCTLDDSIVLIQPSKMNKRKFFLRCRQVDLQTKMSNKFGFVCVWLLNVVYLAHKIQLFKFFATDNKSSELN